MTIHIGAEKGEIAETVLMPGDPYRAKWAAETFLQNARLVNNVRGMLGFTGTWKGNPVSIQGSGMGMPSLSIYVNELIRDYGAKTLIRIGSCGGMQDKVAVRDVILAMTASTLSTPSRGIFKELNFAPCADWSLLKAAADVFWGGHHGYFADPEGHIWEVAHNPFSPLRADGAFRWNGYG